jgi:hypothetical protein
LKERGASPLKIIMHRKNQIIKIEKVSNGTVLILINISPNTCPMERNGSGS